MPALVTVFLLWFNNAGTLLGERQYHSLANCQFTARMLMRLDRSNWYMCIEDVNDAGEAL